MWWRRKDVTIAIQCEGATFSLTVEDNADFIEGFETFKCLGVILDRSKDNWTAVIWKVEKSRRVWNRLGKMIQREGADPRVSAMFYQAVVQIVLLFGAETWFLSEAMYRNLEGGIRRFPKADNGEEGGATGGRDLEAGGSREGHLEGSNSVPRNSS